MNSLSLSDYISLIHQNITDILEMKIETQSEEPNPNFITIRDKDILNDSIKFYECISNEVILCKYKFSKLDEPTYKFALHKIDFLEYVMTLLKYYKETTKDYLLYETNDMKLLFTFIINALENMSIDKNSFKNMSTIINDLIPLDNNNQYQTLFKTQFQEENLFLLSQRGLVISEKVKEKREAIKTLYTYLVCKSDYLDIKDDETLENYIDSLSNKVYYISSEERSFYSSLTKKELEEINNDRIKLNDLDFFKKHKSLFSCMDRITNKVDSINIILMYYGKRYLNCPTKKEYFDSIYDLAIECNNTSKPDTTDIFEILKSQDTRTLFQQIIKTKIVSSFYQNNNHGNHCYEAYTHFVEQMESTENLNNFFDKYIHVVIMSPGYKATTSRYLNIFINGSGYSVSNDLNEKEQIQLKKAFIIVVLLHELTHLLLRLEHAGEEYSQYNTINVSSIEEGGDESCKYAFGLKYLTRITIEQSGTILNPNNWNLKVEKKNKDNSKLIWLMTKIFEEENNSTKYIKFMNTSNRERGWCLHLF